METLYFFIALAVLAGGYFLYKHYKPNTDGSSDDTQTPETVDAAQEDDYADDIIYVIAAAVAAMEQETGTGLRVRSIRRVGDRWRRA